MLINRGFFKDTMARNGRFYARNYEFLKNFLEIVNSNSFKDFMPRNSGFLKIVF